MPCISTEGLRSFTRRLFEALQVPSTEAAWVAELLVRADLAGHDSQGVMRIPQYAQAIRSALAQPGAPIEIVQESPTPRPHRWPWGAWPSRGPARHGAGNSQGQGHQD